MPSKNMIRKGKRRQSVKAEYRLQRDARRDQALVGTDAATPNPAESSSGILPGRPADASSVAVSSEPAFASVDIRGFTAEPASRGMRLDAYLSRLITDLSRSRIQLLIAAGQVTVDGKAAPASLQLRGDEQIAVSGEPQLPPLHGQPEDIPLTFVYEDDEFAVVDKPAGMMVHAGSGSPEHNKGTLVNALLFHFGQSLSGLGGQLRPGIVHRLDKDTSGLILIAKNDRAHNRLSEQFSSRSLHKTYIALVHGTLLQDEGTVDLPISRDLVRRIRMTTRRADGRAAITHWKVLERLQTDFGVFTLVDLRIETGRTHQIRVHMQALGHPVVGDTVYGAPEVLRIQGAKHSSPAPTLSLGRNFLHAAEIQLQHPFSGEALHFSAALAPELHAFLLALRSGSSPERISETA